MQRWSDETAEPPRKRSRRLTPLRAEAGAEEGAQEGTGPRALSVPAHLVPVVIDAGQEEDAEDFGQLPSDTLASLHLLKSQFPMLPGVRPANDEHTAASDCVALMHSCQLDCLPPLGPAATPHLSMHAQAEPGLWAAVAFFVWNINCDSR